MPTVFLGENLTKNSNESYVTVDNYKGTYQGVEYLYQLGHRDILYFGRRRGSATHQLREDGYTAACEALKLKPQYYSNTFSQTSIKNGYLLAKQLFSQPRTYTAIFASTDTNALGVLQAAEEMNIRIPQDISLMGFDNIQYADLPRIQLTTVGQPIKVLASVAIDCLLEQISNDIPVYSHRVVAPSLVERDTCSKPSGI